MTQVLGRQPRRRALVALLIGALDVAQLVGLGPRQLGGGEAVRLRPPQLLQHHVQPARHARLVHPRPGDQHRAGPHQVAAPGAGAEVGRIRHLAALEQALVDQLAVQTVNHQPPVGRHVLAGFRGQLAVQGERSGARFRVGHHAYPRLPVIGYRELRAGDRRVGAPRPRVLRLALRRRGEVTANGGLDPLLVEVPHRGHRHQLRPVPGVGELAQAFRGGAGEHLRLADRAPHGVAGIAEQHRKLAVPDAGGSAAVGAPLLHDHVPLLHHLVGIEGDGVGPVGENAKPGLQRLRVGGGEFELVHGFVEAGVGVEVGPEPAAERFQVFDDFVLGEALGAVERHVLHEVREPALLFLLQDRSGAYRQPQLGAVARLDVAPHVVDQPVAQRSPPHRRVERQRSAGGQVLGQGRRGGGGGQPQKQRERRGGQRGYRTTTSGTMTY